MCSLFFAFASYLFSSLYSFIDCVSYHVFLVSSGVRQLLSLATEEKTVREEANKKQTAL